MEPDFLGASAPTNNTGDVSAVIWALRLIETHPLAPTQAFEICTDSFYAMNHCCSIASCIGYFELFCALLFTYCAMPTLLCYFVYRSTAQWTVYLHRQELSVIDGQFCW